MYISPHFMWEDVWMMWVDMALITVNQENHPVNINHTFYLATSMVTGSVLLNPIGCLLGVKMI